MSRARLTLSPSLPSLRRQRCPVSRLVEKRHRLLPARVVVYFTLAMCLWADEEYVEVARLLAGGLKTMVRWHGSWQVPTSGAITQARARLGPDALKLLFERVAAPMSSKGAVGSWWRGRRCMAIDGTVFDVPDTTENAAHFSRPGSGRGDSAFPQARVVALAECGTHTCDSLSAAHHFPSHPGYRCARFLPPTAAGPRRASPVPSSPF